MMDKLDKSIEVMELYDVYQDILTDKQKEYTESYYFEDMSISEIAEELSVSRNAVHDQIKRTVKKLYDLEGNLKLREKSKQRSKLYAKINKENNLESIKNLIEEFEKVE